MSVELSCDLLEVSIQRFREEENAAVRKITNEKGENVFSKSQRRLLAKKDRNVADIKMSEAFTREP